MNARHLIFGLLGVMLVLVGVLVFSTNDSSDREAVANVPVAEAPAPGAELDDPATEPPLDSARADATDPGPAAESAAPAPPDDGAAPGHGPARDDGAASQPDAGPTASPAGEGSPAAAGGSAGSDRAPSDAQAPDLAKILRATSDRYESVRSLQADFQQRLRNTLLGTTVSSAGTLYQRSPDRFLMRFSEPEGDVIVSDGQYFWIYLPSTDPGQVIRTRRGAQGLDLKSQFIGDPVERFDATYHGTEDVRGRTTHVITLDPKQAVGYRTLKVWIDAQDHLVRRFELTEENGTVRHFELTDLQVNPSLPDRLFQFTPPAGAQVIDRG